MYKFFKPGLISYLNLAIFLCFFFVGLLSLNVKLFVAHKLLPDFELLIQADIIRSEISFYVALLLWFFLSIVFKSNKWLFVFNLLLFLLLSFFILKLLGVYAITHDATPYAMIEYGSYMFSLAFINPASALLCFILLPCLIFFINYFYYLKEHKRQFPDNKPWLHLIILVALCLAFLPPLQTKLPLSLAYHPYIFTFQNAFTQKPILLAKNTGGYEKKDKVLDTLENLNPEKNIVLIILESVASNAISEKTSPFMHQLKGQSLNFEQAFAVIPHTSKALVAIHCGFTPYLDPYLFESTLGIPHDCLPALLKKKGYQSVYFQSPTEHFENRRALINNLGFDEFLPLESMRRDGFEKVNYFGYEDKVILPKSHEWLSEHVKNSREPFIASYLTGTTHHNYDTPEGFQRKNFSTDTKVNRYLNAVFYIDHFVSELIQQYKDLDIYDNTLFIIVSDHGEGFGGHKPLLHNNNLYNSGIKVPLIVHHNSIRPQSIDTPLSHLSILTIALSLASDKNTLDSTTLEENILSSCWYQNYCYSLIRKQEEKIFKYLFVPIDKHSALYEISNDPEEKNNIISQYPELAASFKKLLIENLTQDYNYYHSWYQDQDKDFIRTARNTFSPFKSPE